MNRLERAARASYGRHLEQGEEVSAAADAFAAATGRIVLYAIAIGALCGFAAWTFIDNAALLPLIVFGAITGVVAGVVVATRRVRAVDEPGALIVKLAITNRRLLLLRGRTAARLKPLRSIKLQDIDHLEATPAAIGDYRHFVIHLEDGTSIRLLVTSGRAAADLVAGYEALSP